MSDESDFRKIGQRMLEIDPKGEVVQRFAAALGRSGAKSNLRSMFGRGPQTGPQNQPL